MMDGPNLWQLGTALFSAGVVIGGFKFALNGARKDVRETKDRVKETNERVDTLENLTRDNTRAHAETRESLARVETTLTHVVAKLDKIT